MHTDVAVANAALDLYLRVACYGQRELRLACVHVRRCGTDEYVRNRVPSWIAPLATSQSLVGLVRRGFVLMRGEAVVMLDVIMIAVGVHVEQ